MLKAFFHFLFWLLGFIIIGAALYSLCLITGHPPELAAIAMGVLLLLALAILLARRFFIRRLQLRRIQQIVSVEHQRFEDSHQEKGLLKNRWQRAIALLRSSYLGRFGNPVYALPWYMVMGKSGAGKSSAIRFSGLTAMQTDLGPDPDNPRTRNCDWWFFREAVVLDTAGRYAVPENEAADSGEWQEFLHWLAKYRRREPLNGLVIAVSADRLRDGGGELKDEARCQRRRIDEIMRILGASFPVYLMVTKIDLLAGMARVLDGLPPTWKLQSAGKIMQSPEAHELTPVALQVKKALQEIAERFRALCLFSPDEAAAPRPHALLAAEEIKALMPALNSFAEELFTENPYQETPLLRGIFFSSALHDAKESRSKVFPPLEELIRRLIRSKEYKGGVFLHDFFSQVLPKDRPLHRPIAEYLRWRSSLRVLAYALMLLLTFGLGTLLSLSFRHNEKALREMRLVTEESADYNMASRIFDFERRYRRAVALDGSMLTYPLPTMGLEQARSANHRFDNRINKLFEQEILNVADKNLEERRSRITEQTSDAEYGMLIADLTWRYDLLKALERGDKMETILRIPAMPRGVLSAFGLENIPSLAPSLAYSVAQYYAEQPDRSARQQTLRSLRAAVTRMPALKGYSLQWLIGRTNASGIAPIRGSLFWTGAASGSLNEVWIEPAFTAAGFAEIMNFVKELLEIVDQQDMQTHVREFQSWYADRYVAEWKKFSTDFLRKALTLSAKNDVNDYMPIMASDQNPFFAFARRMDEELRVVVPSLKETPSWVIDLSLWADAMRLSASKSLAASQESNVLQRLEQTLRGAGKDLNAQFDAAERARMARREELTGYYQKYLDALGELVRFTVADEIAFLAVKNAMPDPVNDPAASSPIHLAKTACVTLQGRIDPAMAADSPVLLLSRGPWTFILERLINKASCQIQSIWEEDVLSKAGALSALQLQQALFAEPGGLARQFADKTMNLFLRRSAFGYQTQKIDSYVLAFNEDFLRFLNEGMLNYMPTQQEYPVTITAIPVDVNDECHEKPFAVTLSLDCAREKQELSNFNSPAEKQFVWQQGNCGDTRLAVRFKSLTLTVPYTGDQGFVRFLQDFQHGSKIFTLADFPEQAGILKSMGFTDLTVRYTFAGSEPLLRSRSYVPGALPFVISTCRR